MTTQSNTIGVLRNVVLAFALILSSGGMFPIIANAYAGDGCCGDYGVSSFAPNDYGVSSFGANPDYGVSSYAPNTTPDYGVSSYAPNGTPDYGVSSYAPNTVPDYGVSSYAPNTPGVPPVSDGLVPLPGTPIYDTVPVYGYGSYPSYFSAGLGFGTGFYPTPVYSPVSTYIPTSTFVPTTTFVPTHVGSYNPPYTPPSNTYSPIYNYEPTTITETTTTSTYSPTETITYAPTEILTYAPTNTYAPTSVYSPTDSHDNNSVYNPSTVTTTTDSHNYTGPVTISVVSQAAPQPTVQYVSGGGSTYVNNSPTFFNTPSYFPTAPAPSCRIVASGGGYGFSYNGNAVILSWSSSGANSGYISPLVGTVAPSGSTTVYPNQNTLYTLTVSGNGGTSSCQTYTSGGYVAPAPAPVYNAPVITQPAAPYVALTQIPYTGFDLGAFGNAMYWILLVGFAVAASYLVLYFRGGAFALVKSVMGSKTEKSVAVETKPVSPAVQGTKSAPAPLLRPSFAQATERAQQGFGGQGGTKDSMISVSKEGSAPRIVVLRA